MSKKRQVSFLLKEAVKQLKKANVSSAILDAQILLAFVIKKERHFLHSHPEFIPSEEEIALFNSLIERRKKSEPIAYLVGYKEFWNHKFKCTRDTLIPRPETETIIELCMTKFANSPPKLALDLGTGTGAIGITLASIWPTCQVVLNDISYKALKVAKENAMAILKKEAKFPFLLCCDWFSALSKDLKFDLITVNPPYVSKDESNLLSKETKDFEPEAALYSRDGYGLGEIESIFNYAYLYLKKGGTIMCEVGYRQAKRVKEIISNIKEYDSIESYKDLSGVERVICASK